MGKALVALVVSIVAGVIVFLLTKDGGPMNPTSPPPSAMPNVVFTEFKVPPGLVGGVVDATGSVFNDGEATAADCRVGWHSHGVEFAPTVTAEFSLPAGSSRDFSLQSFSLSEATTYDSSAFVECSNFQSQRLHRPLTVIQP